MYYIVDGKIMIPVSPSEQKEKSEQKENGEVDWDEVY